MHKASSVGLLVMGEIQFVLCCTVTQALFHLPVAKLLLKTVVYFIICYNFEGKITICTLC